MARRRDQPAGCGACAWHRARVRIPLEQGHEVQSPGSLEQGDSSSHLDHFCSKSPIGYRRSLNSNEIAACLIRARRSSRSGSSGASGPSRPSGFEHGVVGQPGTSARRGSYGAGASRLLRQPARHIDDGLALLVEPHALAGGQEHASARHPRRAPRAGPAPAVRARRRSCSITTICGISGRVDLGQHAVDLLDLLMPHADGHPPRGAAGRRARSRPAWRKAAAQLRRQVADEPTVSRQHAHCPGLQGTDGATLSSVANSWSAA